jgi:hypothetical protein
MGEMGLELRVHPQLALAQGGQAWLSRVAGVRPWWQNCPFSADPWRNEAQRGRETFLMSHSGQYLTRTVG